jgi:thioredoxin-related protein
MASSRIIPVPNHDIAACCFYYPFLNLRNPMKRILIITSTLLIAVFHIEAQEKGIQFEKGMTLRQVFQKAKEENKSVFVDCYTTWCGPCKWMDKEIYTNDTVGAYMNVRFVCLKIQMDRTPVDDSLIKNDYDDAGMLERSYNVQDYPTFLFFDMDGKPLHKGVGNRDVTGFMGLVADASDPKKQFYQVLSKFQPGKIDTAELKGLAWSFAGSDTVLAGNLALDYLTRIPQKQYIQDDNRRLIVQFQGNEKIKNLATKYVAFLLSGVVVSESDLKFVSQFNEIPDVQKLANSYIRQLPGAKLYTAPLLRFIAAFTKTPMDTIGFNVFYYHPDRVDMIEGRNVAEEEVWELIQNGELKALLKKAEDSGRMPDFDSLAKVVSRKYGHQYGGRIVVDGRLSWYSYFARTKNEERCWPDYIAARIVQMAKYRYDTVAASVGGVNDIAWGIFVHCTDTAQLLVVAHWMEVITDSNKSDANLFDTYSCLLYKAGKIDAALKEEEIALQLSTGKNDTDQTKYYRDTIDKMKRGEQIWLQKEYQ